VSARRVRGALARAGAAAALAGALAAAGCAPRPIAPAELPVATLLARFEAVRAARAARGTAMDADVTLWVEGAAGRLPGLQGRLALAGPDAARLRVGSLFGVALDIGARGDTVAAYVPARRVGIELAPAGDSLGVEDAGTLAFRAWAGDWGPPAAAWQAATREDSVRVVTWREAGADLALAVAASGRPAWFEVRRPERPAVRVDYRGWTLVEGAAWPALLVVDEGGGRLTVTCRIARMRRASDPGRARVAVRVPEDAERITLAALRRAVERLGGL
jgi:hypothetical protein